MKKPKTIVLYVLLFILLIGCEEEGSSNVTEYCGFVASELLVEVTAETKSFRIEVEWPPRYYGATLSTSNIYIDENATTAKDKYHFVNTPGEGMVEPDAIGEFWILRSGEIDKADKGYIDVTIIPENITEQVIITYSTIRGRAEGTPIEGEGGLFNQLTVILRPIDSE